MKGHKGGGVKPNQGKGEIACVDREPLFPRLHVSETEKAGPKAPPRNKMALYEQFTVPSHRFIQPTQVATFHQPYGSGYPYMPHYVPSAAYANSSNVQAYSQPSQGTSSSGFTSGSMVVSMEARTAPRQHKVGSTQVLRGLTEATTECITSDEPPQREKFGSSLNDIVESANSLGKDWPQASEKTESLHEVMSSLKEGMEGMHERSDGPSVAANVDGGRSKGLSGGVSAPCDLSERLTKPTQKGVAAKMQAGKSGHNCDSINQSLSANKHCLMQYGTSFELKNSEASRAFLAADDQNLLPDSQGPGFTLGSDKYSSQVQPCCSTLQTFLPKVNKVEGSEGEMGNLAIKSFEEHKTKNKEHDESQPGCCGVSPDNSADFMPVIKPKDVILAIGQQQFWKARKTLLRQQRIFSDQVFQLHKLIMIQQLLAETPGTLIDESVQFETLGECEAPAPQTKRSFNPGTYARNAGDSKKKSKRQPVDVESSPAVSKDVKKEVKFSTPELVHDKISAWGYPSFGQWIGPMAAQGQLYGYQQLAEGLPPVSAFGLPYVSSGSAPPMVSFGIPYCGRQQELPAEMG
ncbi:hypothetical protein L7F22_044561 [Adiantum nelumboides]|nr:hypothetical protein [Adiantum nelumboides]